MQYIINSIFNHICMSYINLINTIFNNKLDREAFC